MKNYQLILQELEKWNVWHQDIAVGVPRPRFFDNLKIFLKTPEILALTGVRRCGKSMLCQQIVNELLKQKISRTNTFFINFEDPIFGDKFNALDLSRLFQEYLNKFAPSGKIYLFLDEVQQVTNWQKFILSLYDSRQNVKVVITGSNSTLLESKLSTILSGRYLSSHIYPLNFAEYLVFNKIDNNMIPPREILPKLQDFLKFGGFPRVVTEKNEFVKNQLLQEYYNTIIEKDVILLNNIKNKTEVKKLALILMSNVASLFSVYKLSRQIGISHQNIYNYLNFFQEAYLINLMPKFDENVKKQVYNPDKLFVVDSGLAHIAGFSMSENFGHYLENLVFNHLKTANEEKEIYYWKNGHEIDFLIKKGTKITNLINVASSINDENAARRETEGLLEAGLCFKDVKKSLYVWEMPENWKEKEINLSWLPDVFFEKENKI